MTTGDSATPRSNTSEKINLFGWSLAELEKLMCEFEEPAFHGRQLFTWMYNRRQYDFQQMTDMSIRLREALSERCVVRPLQEVKRWKSSDGSSKMLYKLDDGALIETVLIPSRDTSAVCISSQVGCPLRCEFCATGTLDLKRNLTVGEIIGQMLNLRQQTDEKVFTNVVFMGMGEPLLNYQRLLSALSIMISSDGLNIPARRITVSTAGITPKIRRLAESGFRVNLAISLHAATQDKRASLMPVAETYDLNGLIKAAKIFAQATRRRITFEYVLLDDVNDTPGDVRALARLLEGIDCKVNLLAYNPVPGLNFIRPSEDAVDRFGRALSRTGLLVTVRKSRGADIAAACGQLAAQSKPASGGVQR